MRGSQWLLVLALLVGQSTAVRGQAPKAIVEQAVQTELAASQNDHTTWLYYEVDRKPGNKLVQWVAETHKGNVRRVLQQNGQKLSVAEQRALIDRFVNDPQLRAKRRKASQHDDEQAAEMLRLLPDGFVWTITSKDSLNTSLDFRPDPNFEPPDWETRVFAAMEGTMVVDNAQHRIVSLKGRLIHDVKFFFGLFGTLQAGGTFDIERRETGDSIWQITATHIHIQGHALLFKNISQEEDDVMSDFKQLPDDITLEQAAEEVMRQPEKPED
jgi:hypothetical protein